MPLPYQQFVVCSCQSSSLHFKISFLNPSEKNLLSCFRYFILEKIKSKHARSIDPDQTASGAVRSGRHWLRWYFWRNLIFEFFGTFYWCIRMLMTKAWGIHNPFTPVCQTSVCPNIYTFIFELRHFHYSEKKCINMLNKNQNKAWEKVIKNHNKERETVNKIKKKNGTSWTKFKIKNGKYMYWAIPLK